MTMTLGSAKHLMQQLAQGHTFRPEAIESAKAVIARWAAIRAKQAKAKAAAAAAQVPAATSESATINLETPVGTRVGLLDMTGTFVGVKTIKRTAKNYCDGNSTIQLAPLVVGLIKWDESPADAEPVTASVSELSAMHQLAEPAPKQYANMHGYSEIEPYEVVRVISEQTMEIRAMKATLSPDWKPEIIPGGFAGHCTNQHTQVWLYESDESAPIIRMRKVKPSHSNRCMTWKSAYGHHKLADKPRKFHDYNF